MPPKNHYQVLQVDHRASTDVIKAAYHALMKHIHPDVGGSSDKASEINEAYAILSDPKSRKEYDASQANREGVTAGSFRFVKMLAEGGFGRTYRGEHILTGEAVCIKDCSEISADMDEILIEETRAMWNLRHYGIPSVRDLLRLENGSLALVMSYIPGLTLGEIVKKHGALDPEHVAWITERILNILEYIHYNGIVHGDLKPQNIMVQGESHLVSVVDFGLSSIRPTAKSKNKGYSEFYSPPEQISNMPLIPESDFYSLGMAMLYALSGSSESVGKKLVPTSVPDPLCRFIKSLIVRNPLDRPNWQKLDISKEFQRVREESFGRRRSNMKPLPT